MKRRLIIELEYDEDHLELWDQVESTIKESTGLELWDHDIEWSLGKVAIIEVLHEPAE